MIRNLIFNKKKIIQDRKKRNAICCVVGITTSLIIENPKPKKNPSRNPALPKC